MSSKVTIRVTEVTEATVDAGDLQHFIVPVLSEEPDDISIWDFTGAEVVSRDVEVVDKKGAS